MERIPMEVDGRKYSEETRGTVFIEDIWRSHSNRYVSSDVSHLLNASANIHKSCNRVGRTPHLVLRNLHLYP